MLSVDYGVHNHFAAEHLKVYSFIGRLSEEKENLVVDMSKLTKRYFAYIETKKQSQCKHNKDNLQCKEDE